MTDLAPVLDQLEALAGERGHDDLAAALRRERERCAGDEAVVVVAGEVGQGKSALVQALAGRLAVGPALVESPAVGDLASAGADTALLALEPADALVFATDAEAPLSGPELAFLERATERVDTVLFALTKVDRYRGWREILAANRELLARHAPRFAGATWVPCSVVAFESGVDELAAALRGEVADRAGTLAERNARRLALTVTDRLEQAERSRLDADDRRVQGELELALARQERFARDASSWPVQLGFEFQRLAMTLDERLDRRSAELVAAYERRVSDWRPELADWLPGALEAELGALAADLELQLQRSLGTLVRRTAEALELDEADLRAVDAGRVTVSPSLERPVVAGADQSAWQGLQSYLLWTGGGARLGLLAPGAGWLFGPVGAAAGLVLAAAHGSFARRRSWQARRRSEALRLVQVTLPAAARSDVRAPLHARLLDARQELDAALRSCIERRSGELVAALAERRRFQQLDSRSKDSARRTAQQTLSRLGRLRRRLDHTPTPQEVST